VKQKHNSVKGHQLENKNNEEYLWDKKVKNLNKKFESAKANVDKKKEKRDLAFHLKREQRSLKELGIQKEFERQKR